jgi:hypothetical protein
LHGEQYNEGKGCDTGGKEGPVAKTDEEGSLRVKVRKSDNTGSESVGGSGIGDITRVFAKARGKFLPVIFRFHETRGDFGV